MASTNDNLEQQKFHTRELTEDELNQTTGGVGSTGSTLFPLGNQPGFHEIPPGQEGTGTIELVEVLEV